MNGHEVSRAHGHGLNGAGEFYYEAVEESQNPGGLPLSPAAFISPAQRASVLEGRFKQLQGGLRGASGGEPRGEGVPRSEAPGVGGAWERSRSQEPGVGGSIFCDSDVCVGRQSAGGVITSGRKTRGC